MGVAALVELTQHGVDAAHATAPELMQKLRQGHHRL